MILLLAAYIRLITLTRRCHARKSGILRFSFLTFTHAKLKAIIHLLAHSRLPDQTTLRSVKEPESSIISTTRFIQRHSTVLSHKPAPYTALAYLHAPNPSIPARWLPDY